MVGSLNCSELEGFTAVNASFLIKENEKVININICFNYSLKFVF